MSFNKHFAKKIIFFSENFKKMTNNIHRKPLAIQGTSSSLSETVLDALPYIDDTDFTEAHRQLANQLIQAECRQFAKTKNYLKHLREPNYDAFLTPCLKDYLQAMAEKRVQFMFIYLKNLIF